MAVGTGLAAKTALAAARSKSGRRLFAAATVVAVTLPLIVVAIPVGLATVGVMAFADTLNPGGDGSGELPICGGSQECEVSADAQDVARQIVELTEQRQVQWLDRRFLSQVQAYAAGTPVAADCVLDVRVMQIIVLAVHLQG